MSADPEFFNPHQPPKGIQVLSILNISGETVAMGTHSGKTEDCLFLWVPAQAEPTYFSLLEADLLAAALRHAQDHLRGNN